MSLPMRAAIERVRRGDPLSDRQHKVMQLYAEGRTRLQISLALGVSETTVWYHTECAKKKLGASKIRDAAVTYAVALAKGRKV